jgi:hypothetical protein
MMSQKIQLSNTKNKNKGEETAESNQESLSIIECLIVAKNLFLVMEFNFYICPEMSLSPETSPSLETETSF